MQVAPQQQLDRLRALGLFFCLVGFAVIALGWHGSARRACVDCQFPYLISGGVGGLALVLVGAALLVVAQVRIESARLARQLDRLAEPNVGALAGTRLDASELVLAGSATYHRPDCRLVKSRDDLPTRTVQMARAEGLVPCRVCQDADEHAGTRPGTST